MSRRTILIHCHFNHFSAMADRAAREALRRRNPYAQYMSACPVCFTRDTHGILDGSGDRVCASGHHLTKCKTKHDDLDRYVVFPPPDDRSSATRRWSWRLPGVAVWPRNDDGTPDRDALLDAPCECEMSAAAWKLYNASSKASKPPQLTPSLPVRRRPGYRHRPVGTDRSILLVLVAVACAVTVAGFLLIIVTLVLR